MKAIIEWDGGDETRRALRGTFQDKAWCHMHPPLETTKDGMLVMSAIDTKYEVGLSRQWVKCVSEGSPVIYIVHLHFKNPDTAGLLGSLSSETRPVCVVGDFNKHGEQLIQNGLMATKLKTPTYQPKGDPKGEILDYAIHSSSLSATIFLPASSYFNHYVDSQLLSDHCPVMVKISD